MTPGELPKYEVGQRYKMAVWFAQRGTPYINVRHDSGTVFKVEVTGTLNQPIERLKNKVVELVCTAVTDKGPEFVLAGSYFDMATGGRKPRKGQHLGLKEGPTVEFKQSLIFSPETHQADPDQLFNIAREVAAFMNARGGDLYLGVNNDGFVTGIEGDLPHLGDAPIMSDFVTDEKWTYRDDIDAFKTKLTTAIRAYLGAAAMGLVESMDDVLDPTSGLHYVKVHIEPSMQLVYVGREEEVVYRGESSVLPLKGRQRESYVKARFYEVSEMPIAQRVEGLAKMFELQEAKVAAELAVIRKLLESGSAA